MTPSNNESNGDQSEEEKPDSLGKGETGYPPIDLAATMLDEWQSALGDTVEPGQTIKVSSFDSDELNKTVKLSDELDVTQQSPWGSTSDDDFVVGVGYEVEQLLGEGGMGAVYAGRQQSMDRPVAIKMLKPDIEQMDGSQRAFTSEAIITGGLDHPNIVPIYDLGKQKDDVLFYAMKQVEGVEWKDRIETNSLSENLDILLRVADAVAFAHDRCIIHRDLKPANIMLGSFGEVLLMDWGLAMPTQDHPRREVYSTPAPGGTPYYMAPEMINGVDQVDRRSDVYLLGGILFQMITGKPPHTLDAPPETQREKVTACLAAVSQNVIAATEKTGELLDIARKAMATDPGERYQSVAEFQQAIRKYLLHEESIEHAARADERLAVARKNGNYDDFSRARFGFETALEDWSENVRAIEGLKATKFDYAKTALDHGDLDLGLSLLDENDAEHATLRSSIQTAIAKRDARQQQVRRLKRVVFGASLVVAVVACVATVWINSERDKALAAQEKALAAQKEEATQREQAQRSAEEAQSQRQVAIAAKEIADEERKKAIVAQQIAQENEKKAVIAEARAKTEAENALKNFKVAERNAYYSDMLLLQKAWQDPDPFKLQQILLRYRNRKDLRGFEWDYWDRTRNERLLSFEAHKQPIFDIAFSPDGTKIASASGDKTVKLWEVATKQEILTLRGHTSLVKCLSFSPDGSRLVSACGAGMLKVWDVVTGEEQFTIQGHSQIVNDVSFSPDGKLLASASNDRTVKVWNAITGKERLTFEGHQGKVSHVFGLSFHPDGKRLASTGRDRTVKVWEIETGKVLKTFRGHTSPVLCVSYSPDGKQLVTGSVDGTVKLWDTATGVEKLSLKGHASMVTSIVFSPDGSQLVSGGEDRFLKLWDVATGEEINRFRGHTYIINCVAFSPDGTRLVSAGNSGSVMLWSVADSQGVLTLDKHRGQVKDVALSADGRQLVSVGEDKIVRAWHPRSGQEAQSPGRHNITIGCVTFNGDGTRLATGDYSGIVKVWDTVKGEEILSLNAHSRKINGLSISPDGTLLVSTSKGGSAKIWDIATGQVIHTIKSNTVYSQGVAFSPDGKRLALLVIDKTVKIYNPRTGEEKLTLGENRNHVLSVTFSPDGTQLASGMTNGLIKLWDSDSGKEIYSLIGHTGNVKDVAFSPDGKRLASAGIDHMVKIWDSATGHEALTLEGHTDWVGSVMFSSDGKRLISSSFDGTVKVWDSQRWTDQIRAEHYARGLLIPLRERVNSLEELRKWIAEDKTLSERVRKQTLKWANQFWKNRVTRIRRKPKSGK